MCVIGTVLSEKGIPTMEMLDKMQRTNIDGGGVAWPEDGVIKYRKGVDAKDIYEIIQRRLFPTVFHFRLSTAGGRSRSLCHPFPITADMGSKTEGSAPEVLFHNGHYNDWRNELKSLVLHRDIRMPRGAWSDSRAIAFLTYHIGEGYLNLIESSVGYGQKFVRLCADTRLAWHYGTFIRRDGLWLSNEDWDRTTYTAYSRSWENDEDYAGNIGNSKTVPGIVSGKSPSTTIEGKKDAQLHVPVIGDDEDKTHTVCSECRAFRRDETGEIDHFHMCKQRPIKDKMLPKLNNLERSEEKCLECGSHLETKKHKRVHWTSCLMWKTTGGLAVERIDDKAPLFRSPRDAEKFRIRLAEAAKKEAEDRDKVEKENRRYLPAHLGVN